MKDMRLNIFYIVYTNKYIIITLLGLKMHFIL